MRILRLLSDAFPIWVLSGALAAFFHPEAFIWFKPWIVSGLAVIMLGMGMTLRFSDLKQALSLPKVVAVGVLAQFSIMPFLGWSIAKGFQLPTEFAVGLILVACCPGGTASNVVSYLARANVALSVLMTVSSTFAAVLLTPLLTQMLAGAYVPVPAMKLLADTAKVVLLPVLAGTTLLHFFPKAVQKVLPAAPLLSVITIAMICATIIGLNAGPLRESGLRLLGAVAALHSGGFALGYLLGRALGYDQATRRTLSIEVGMQNSGLGVVLAQNFRNPETGLVLAALPCAISATMHSVIGSLLAGIWRLRAPKAKGTTSPT
jgi:BASS family bile acid:Na+ symporter